MDHFTTVLCEASAAVEAAAVACRAWEDDGDPDPLADTAWDADGASLAALEAVAGIDPTLVLDGYPETRLGRLVMAARLLVLAGTDEAGRSDDLALATQLLKAAAES